MKVKDFDYDLPQELIAQTPLPERTDSRLLVMDRKTGEITHTVFRQITDYLKPGDCLVLNNTKVIPARLFGIRAETGAQVEVLLLRQAGSSVDISTDKENGVSENADGNSTRNESVWETLVKPGKKARPGTELIFGDGLLRGTVEDIVDDGNRLIRFSYDGIFEEILDQLGQMPLPPYITEKLEDKSRYQTVYAKYDGSAAAPTAGLHFTQALLDQIEAMGVIIANVTLHVGLGTFRPVKVEEVTDHHMHSEFYRVEEEDVEKIRRAKASGGRVIAVGTTSCRTLESVMQKYGEMRACSGWTDIFIYPGYEFQCIDGLVTNFHLPQSTLLMLVSAFAGREHIMHAYEEAIRLKYRFFSFGDAMLMV